MIVRYAGGESGARDTARAGASVLVVDAFRASTTVAVLISKGARGACRLNSRSGIRWGGLPRRIAVGTKITGFGFGNPALKVERLLYESNPEFPFAEDTVRVVIRLVSERVRRRAEISRIYVRKNRPKGQWKKRGFVLTGGVRGFTLRSSRADKRYKRRPKSHGKEVKR